MAVPADIRAVPRPVNTVVIDNGKDGPKRYAVRQRDYSKYIPGGNPQPRNGKVIGHIIDHKFVPVEEEKAGPEMLSYGASALVKSLTRDLFSDLLDVYPAPEVYAIMAIATLQVIKPSVSTATMSELYKSTFVCQDYPGAALSKNSVDDLLQRLGQDGQRRRQFYQKRMAKAAEHHIAIDKTLKQDSGVVNDLSNFSLQTRTKSHEVSVLYAYDVEQMEPLCAESFLGKSMDACSAFICDNDIRKGTIITDKGFPLSKIRKELQERPDLHFLKPAKRNDIRIQDYDMLAFEGILEDTGAHVLYKKKQIKSGRYLYAYRDVLQASKEEASYLEAHKDFNQDEYRSKSALFGVTIFESDQDMDPKAAYLCCNDSRILKLVFDHYKSDLHLDKKDDFLLIGAEFVNFISTVATCRIIRKAQKAGLLDKMSYGELMDDLSSAWRLTGSPENPKTNDKYWAHTPQYVFAELEALGLSEPEKRGRKQSQKKL